jgi:CheY-like chemotaxis protein
VRAQSSGVGQSSTFTVRLPLATQTEAIANSSETAAILAPAGGRRVSIIDDNEDAATSLAQILEHLGHQVLTANNGEQGIARAAAFHPDVIFLDLGMPGMDGIETARLLPSLPNASETTLIALTGWGREEILQRTKDVGFNYHVLKPVDLNSLQELLSPHGNARPH